MCLTPDIAGSAIIVPADRRLDSAWLTKGLVFCFGVYSLCAQLWRIRDPVATSSLALPLLR